MSEEASINTGSLKSEGHEDDCLRDSCCSDDDSANDLFNSFMQIVKLNDPEHQDKKADQLHEMVDQNDQMHAIVDQNSDVDGIVDETDQERGMLPSRKHDENEESNKDTMADDGALLATDTTEGDANGQESSTNNSDTKNIDSDSVGSKSNTAMDRVSAEPQSEQDNVLENEDSSEGTDLNLNMGFTRTFTIEEDGGSEHPDTNTAKQDNCSATNSSVALSGNVALSGSKTQSANETHNDMVGSVKSSGSETDLKDDSNRGQERHEPIKDPGSMQADKDTRWSRAMEHLEGLEQQLFSAVAEFQRSNSLKDKEADKQRLATSDGEITHLVHASEQQDEAVLSTNIEEIGPQHTDKNVSKDEGANENEHTLQPAGTSCKSSSEVRTDQTGEPLVLDTKNIEGGSGTEVEQCERVTDSLSTDDELQNTRTADRTPAAEVVMNEMPSTQELTVDSTSNQVEPSLEKSDSEAELDLEVAKACGMPVPEIEIVTTDESGISERKSLDSLDTEGSSNSRAASPAFSDEGIDSDAQSDCGDDDEETTFDRDAVKNSRRKSSLLERDRSRLSSDSSTVSEVEFKERFTKGDNADGNLSKDCIRGYLLKMGGTGLTPKNWRRRWFVLEQDNCLYYYKHAKDKEPCGVIVLCNYSVSKAPEVNKRHCMKLTKGGARTYYMCAGSEDERKQWMVALMDAVKDSAVDSNLFHVTEGNLHNVSIPALSIRDPECHGYLYKQGHSIKTWRRRYFVLKHGFLYYYSDMSNTVALGVAKLHGYAMEEGTQTGKKFCFSAISPDSSSRTYYFAAESEMDRKRWLSRLEESIKRGSLCF